MKRNKLNAAIAIVLCASFGLTSCIGSFSLTNKIKDWNENIGSKFVNEVVFLAFHIVPVYGVAMFADMVVFNSIEFWTGDNVIAQQSTQEIQGENGDMYLVTTDENGYTITNQTQNTTIGFVFDKNDNSWSINANGETTKFMTFIDNNHVVMPDVNGNDMVVELSQAGVMAYREVANSINLALK